MTSFLTEKSCGFIRGDDGRDYFVHLDDVAGHVSLVDHQVVTFEASTTARGYRARSVRPGPAPHQVYLDPGKFFMIRETAIPKHVIVQTVVQNCWYESNDPNQAREGLKRQAQQWGANAIVGLRLQKYSKRDGCSNYRYTMHRYYGHAVIAKKVGYSTDTHFAIPDVRDMHKTGEGAIDDSVGDGLLVRPPWWRLIPSIGWALVRTAMAIALALIGQKLTLPGRRVSVQ